MRKIRLNLQDFAAVVIINLAVSLFVALFFVPAMIDRIKLVKKRQSVKRWVRSHIRIRRLTVYFTHFYQLLIRFLLRWRVAVCILLLLGFGLPVFLLPEKLEGEGKWIERITRRWAPLLIKRKVKPVVDKALGGSLRLFVQKVYEGSYFSRNEEVVLMRMRTYRMEVPLEQMNTLVKRVETYLSGFKEIKQFHASVYNARRGQSSDLFQERVSA